MSSNTAVGTIVSQTASDNANAVHQKAAEKCQLILANLYDSFNGYKQCAADTENNTMKLLFDNIANSRSHFIAVLSNIIQVNFGVQPVTSGSALAIAHRTWIDVKSWFTDGRDKATIISDIHHGENVLIELYQSAIEDTHMTIKIRELLYEQLKKVKEQLAAIDVL